MIIDTYGTLIAAATSFVASHLVMSSPPIKEPAQRVIGPVGFLAVYSGISLTTFVWMIQAYGAAPVNYLWQAPTWVRHLPMGLMLLSCFLLVGGYTTGNPSATSVLTGLLGLTLVRRESFASRVNPFSPPSRYGRWSTYRPVGRHPLSSCR